MNDHEQNVVIAKFLGLDIDHVRLKPHPDFHRRWHYFRVADIPKTSHAMMYGKSCTNPAWIPEYTEDLNACHEMEKRIMDESSIRYVEELSRVSCIWHAAAPQRCKAFLKTINKWTGE